MKSIQYNLEVVPLAKVNASKELFNTTKHSVDEDPILKSEALRPYNEGMVSFGQWRSVVLASRGTDDVTPPAVELGQAFTDELKQKALAAYITGHVDKNLSRDLDDDFPQVMTELREVLGSNKRWFVRTDESSPKDVHAGPSPICDMEQLLRQLLLSIRFLVTIERHQDLQDGLRLHFLPWDDEMNSLHEFRVFCAPAPSIKDLRITAISQYSWWQSLPGPIRERISFVVDNAEFILRNCILSADEAIVSSLLQGFSFDILLRASDCVLVELNGFGALQNTGSALFHWLNDYQTLYGFHDGERIIVRICE